MTAWLEVRMTHEGSGRVRRCSCRVISPLLPLQHSESPRMMMMMTMTMLILTIEITTLTMTMMLLLLMLMLMTDDTLLVLNASYVLSNFEADMPKFLETYTLYVLFAYRKMTFWSSEKAVRFDMLACQVSSYDL